MLLLCSLLIISILNDPYLHHLADIIYDFGLKRGPNLKAFLDEYHRKKDKIAVQIPEAEDAIKIMTIHKSKGLEFPVVLIPTLNFSMKIKSSFLVGIDDFIVYFGDAVAVAEGVAADCLADDTADDGGTTGGDDCTETADANGFTCADYIATGYYTCDDMMNTYGYDCSCTCSSSSPSEILCGNGVVDTKTKINQNS